MFDLWAFLPAPPTFLFVWFFFFFIRHILQVAQNDLNPVAIQLPQLPKLWDCRCTLPGLEWARSGLSPAPPLFKWKARALPLSSTPTHILAFNPSVLTNLEIHLQTHQSTQLAFLMSLITKQNAFPIVEFEYKHTKDLTF